ncbi:DUF2306 domain-containing protein [Micromonospora sp. NPDC049559]|uniref:DUF2306 domain-containing protein n=1 Tax=Micromonospora sp. NPDC049559 TaxID=3155923 RepID=UPI00341EC76E
MTQRTEQTITSRPGRTGPWWRRPWVVPLAVLTIAFLAFSLPPYLTFDPDRSRLPLREGFAWHYPLLLAHIGFGTVALVTSCLQVWPWFRRRYPAAHRWLGRAYFFAGVLPGGLAGVVVAVVSLQGVVGRIGNALLAVVWLLFSLAGYRMARQRRYAEHRRWMVRSFALTTSIVVNRLWLVLAIVALTPLTDSYYGGDEDAMIQAAAESSIWLSWVVNLLVAEWWLERSRAPRRRGRTPYGDRSATPADAAASAPSLP